MCQEDALGTFDLKKYIITIFSSGFQLNFNHCFSLLTD